MKESIFIRLTKEEDKETALRRCLADLTSGRVNDLTHTARQETFSLIPDSPMAYWVADSMRRKFIELPSYEGNGGQVKTGLCTGDDFRFVRAFWEVGFFETSRRWIGYPKGGEFARFYGNDSLLVDWHDEGASQASTLGGRVQGQDFYFRFGLTYTAYTIKGFNVRILPSKTIFSHAGKGIFPQKDEDAWFQLGLFNSRLIQVFLLMQTSRKWEVGYVQNIPYLLPDQRHKKNISANALKSFMAARDLDRVNETSYAFTRPALLGKDITGIQLAVENLRQSTSDLERLFISWFFTKEAVEVQIVENSCQIDQTILDLYEVSERDRHMIDRELRPHSGSYPRKNNWGGEDDKKLRLLYLTKDTLPEESDEEDSQEDNEYVSNNHRRSRRTTYRTLEEIAHELKVHPATIAARRKDLSLYRPDDFIEAVASLISYCVGCLFSRWDIRIGAGELEPPPLPDPEEGLPLYPPGALRPDSPPMEARGALAKVLEHSARRGILVDDPGHKHDLVAGVEACLMYLFGEENLPAIRAEIEEALGRDLWAWLARNFFPLHIKRYSKSRRKAPIYWQLSTPGKGYSLWLYYHATGADTLYTALREYVSPKIVFEEGRLAEFKDKFERVKTSGPAREARRAEKAIEDQEAFLAELYVFRSELQRLADWGYNPDLNDGVIINIAPLHRLVPWREAEKTWQQLVQGDYDWSSMARHIKERGARG